MRPRVTLPLSSDLVHRAHRDVDRNRKREPHVPAGAREDQRVDADDLAPEIEQRAAGVARIDRGVRLDVGDQVFLRQVASLGADDARGHRVLETEGLADRDDPLAHLELVRIADRHLRQIPGFDLQHGDVGALVGADDLGLELATVGELDADLVGAVDDVGVGDEVAVGRDDETRTDRLLVELALRPAASRNLAEAAEEFVERVVFGKLRQALSLHLLRDVDADDGRALLFVQVGEVGKSGRASLGRGRGGESGQHGQDRDENRHGMGG